ncbi:MAG: type III secretion system chaperone [Pseudomonadota bacterium]
MSETQDMMASALEAAIAATLSREDIDALLARLPEAGGPAGIVLEGEPAMAMALADDDRPITITYLPGFPGLVLSAPVCDVEDLPRLVLLRLLAANATWEITAGGIFAIPTPGGPLTYCRRIALPDLAAASCVEAMDAFAAYCADWEQRLDLYAELPEGEDPSTVAGAPGVIPV